MANLIEYNEIRSKLQKEFLSRVHVDDNSFNFSADFYNTGCGNFEIVCKYSINGHDYETVIRENYMNLRMAYREPGEAFEMFFEEKFWKPVMYNLREVLVRQFVKSHTFRDLEKLFMK